MAMTGDANCADFKTMKEAESPASRLQFQLAASLLDSVIVKNAGRDAADAFWDDDCFDLLEDTDPDLGDPDVETLPEMDIIWHNIFECD